jgi:molybdenum cofactor guanylyltransferase
MQVDRLWKVERLSYQQAVYDRTMSGGSSGVSAFILAGGKSRRMGTDKAFVVLKGRTLLDWTLALARAVGSDVRIVCAEDRGEVEKFQAFAPVVEDVFQGRGPLGGIHAALEASTAELNVMLAVDAPLVTRGLLEFLISRARSSQAMVTVPRVGGGWQPLCAVYRREFAEVAEAALRAGRNKIDALFDPGRTLAIEEAELTKRGFSAEMFRNLNTPEELAGAGRVAG